MKKKWFIGTLFALIVGQVSGQTQMDVKNKILGKSTRIDVIDMSREALHEEEENWDGNDAVRRVDVLNELAFQYMREPAKRDTVRSWIEEAKELAKAHYYLKGEGDAWVRSGLLELYSGKLGSASGDLKKALIIRRDQLKDIGQAARVCNNLGLVYERQKDSIPTAIAYYQEGLRLYSLAPATVSNKRSRARLMSNMAELLGQIGNYNYALIYLDSALQVRKELEDSVGIGNTLLNLGGVYKRLGNLEQSGIFFRESLQVFELINDRVGIAKCLHGLGNIYNNLGDYHTALDFYQKTLADTSFLDHDYQGRITQDMAIAYLNLGQFETAEKYYLATLELFKKANNDSDIMLLYLNLAGFYKDQGKYEDAIGFYKEGMKYMGETADLTTKVNLLNYLGETYMAMEMPDSALKYATRFLEFQDTLVSAFEVAMNNQYNQAVAKNQILRLNIEKEIETQKIMKTYGMIAFGVTWLLLGLALMGYYINRQRRRLAEQGEELSQQKVIELMQEKELETNYAWINGVETTRRKIGQELHDDIGNMLSIVKVHFATIEDKIANIQHESHEQYQKANNLLDEACEKVRHLSHEMTSAILVKFGLKNQLESLAETLRESRKFQVELSTYGLKERLSTQTEFNIYRIIQELVTNVIKHAQARKLSIQVNRFDEMINLMVEDDGLGFDLQKAKKEGGIGMKNVASRVHELEGTINIDTAPGKGTSIAIDIPIFADEPLTLKD